MQTPTSDPAYPVVLTTDPELLDQVLAVAAIAGVEPRVVPDASALRDEWSVASIVVVGIDWAQRVAGLALGRRTDTYLVGTHQFQDELSRWSVQLGAAVVRLPEGATWLTNAIAERGSRPHGGARLLAMVGGAGGVGCSTLAAGFSFVAVRLGYRTLLLDCDQWGGGIDLLVGAERVEGWRWPQFAAVSGDIGELDGQLPQVDGLNILSMARSTRFSHDRSAQDPGRVQMESVLSSASRSYDLIVSDLPRALGEGPRQVLHRSDHVVLIVPATIRGIASSSRVSSDCKALGASPVIAVRQPRAAGIGYEAVAHNLGLPIVAVIADEPRLRLAAQRGDPPGRLARSPLTLACRELLDQLMPSEAVA